MRVVLRDPQPPRAPEICYANAVMRKLLTICCTAAVLLLGSTEGDAYKASDLEKLKSTGTCPNCDLQAADLRGAKLQKANLSRARLEGAKFDSDDLEMAKAQGAIGLDSSGSNIAKAVPEKPKPPPFKSGTSGSRGESLPPCLWGPGVWRRLDGDGHN